MSHLTTVERAVWAAWNTTPDDHPSPVKRIAADLGMTPADVAFIVYPVETFGRWADDQEPDVRETPMPDRHSPSPERSLFTRFEGGWCDNCRTAWSFTPRDGCCPSCRPVKLRAARITVEPHDVDAEEVE